MVIDVGIHRLTEKESVSKKLCGDVDFEDVSTKVKAITPVPGGVGPMTVAMLLVNTVNSWIYKNRLNLKMSDITI